MQFQHTIVFFFLTSLCHDEALKLNTTQHLKQTTMKKQILSLLLVGAMLVTSCASTTIIQSNPSGANVYLNGQTVGITPYTYTDKKIVGTRVNVKLQKEGYEPVDTHFNRVEKLDVGALIGGILVDFPLLWIMKYKPEHNYDLVPTAQKVPSTNDTPQQPVQGSTKP